MTNTDASAIRVIAVRYRNVTLAENDERALDAYAESGVYQSSGLPASVVEPRISEAELTGDVPTDIGSLNGLIADEVAAARAENKVVLMTGGNCCHITGIVGGLQDAHGPEARIGLVWFDAHGDFNTPNTTLSGMLGGMPVAVCAGLCFPTWRQRSHIVAPLPTDRIVMTDVRNLDPAEETLVRAVGIPITAVAPGFPGEDLIPAINDLSDRCDLIYLHIDADILDESYTPDHGTREPNGPDMEQVLAAVDTVMSTGKVVAFAVVSVYAGGAGRDISVQAGIELIGGGLRAWTR